VKTSEVLDMQNIVCLEVCPSTRVSQVTADHSTLQQTFCT